MCSHAWVRVPPLAFFPPLSIVSMTQYIQNYQEVLYYDSIYAFALKDDSDALSGKAAVTFLKKSNLSAEDIRRVQSWNYVDCRSGSVYCHPSRCKSTKSLFEI